MRSFYFLLICLLSTNVWAQTNPLWSQQKVKNYLPHMTVPEVEKFLEKSDMVLIPVGAMEQHGLHLPLGTDFISQFLEEVLVLTHEVA